MSYYRENLFGSGGGDRVPHLLCKHEAYSHSNPMVYHRKRSIRCYLGLLEVPSVDISIKDNHLLGSQSPRHLNRSSPQERQARTLGIGLTRIQPSIQVLAQEQEHAADFLSHM